MASQIAHIVYAKKYFESIEKAKVDLNSLDETRILKAQKIDRDQFMLGVVFPDIRLIDPKIKRQDTHLKFVPLDLDFSGLSWFEAGWKFHLYCDMRREEFLNQSGFYSLQGASDFFGRPAKLWEDELIYDTYDNWEKLVAYFRNSPRIEEQNLADDKTVALWYAILATYMERKPDEKAMRVFLAKLAKLKQKSDEMMEALGRLKKNDRARKILMNIQEEIVKA